MKAVTEAASTNDDAASSCGKMEFQPIQLDTSILGMSKAKVNSDEEAGDEGIARNAVASDGVEMPAAMASAGISRGQFVKFWQNFHQWIWNKHGEFSKAKSITRNKYANIVHVLRHRIDNIASLTMTSNFYKFLDWMRTQQFLLGNDDEPWLTEDVTTAAVQHPVLWVARYKTPEQKRPDYVKVAIVEDYFQILNGIHLNLEELGHKIVGQKKLYKTASSQYAYLSREAVSIFLRLCPHCEQRRQLVCKFQSETPQSPRISGGHQNLHGDNTAAAEVGKMASGLLATDEDSGLDLSKKRRKRRASDEANGSVGSSSAGDCEELDTKEEDEDEDDQQSIASGRIDEERLKAFNLFVRFFVDENMDRMVPISKQPKDKLNGILEACDRQFPEFFDRARKRVRTYLKACRRNGRKHGGVPTEAMLQPRTTPSHLTSATAENILERALSSERDYQTQLHSVVECARKLQNANSVKLDQQQQHHQPQQTQQQHQQTQAQQQQIQSSQQHNQASQRLQHHQQLQQQQQQQQAKQEPTRAKQAKVSPNHREQAVYTNGQSVNSTLAGAVPASGQFSLASTFIPPLAFSAPFLPFHFAGAQGALRASQGTSPVTRESFDKDLDWPSFEALFKAQMTQADSKDNGSSVRKMARNFREVATFLNKTADYLEMGIQLGNNNNNNTTSVNKNDKD